MKKLLLLLILLLFSPLLFAQSVNLNYGETATKKYFEEIDFEFVKNKIIIPVEINGKTYRFILDTGAPNIISKELQEEISINSIKETTATDANNKKDTLSVVNIENLKIGNITFKNAASLVYDINAVNIFKCFKIDGFIGSNLLRNSILQIDLKSKKIRLTNNKNRLNLNKRNSIEMLVKDNQSSPFIRINLEGEKQANELVLIDTGMHGFYEMSINNFRKIENYNIYKVLGISKGAASVSLFGDVPQEEHLRLLAPKMIIGNVAFVNVTTITSNDRNSKIGSELLKYGLVTLDYKNKRFYFDANEHNIDLQEKTIGFSITVLGTKLVVGYVWDVELKNKLSYGDEIIKVNGKVISNLTFCDHVTKESLTHNEDSIKIEIRKKSGEILILNIEKKSVI